MSTLTLSPVPGARLWWGLVRSETAVLLRQRVMLGLILLVPAGLLAFTALAERSDDPAQWAAIAGRNTVAALCVTVYFVSLSTLTARRHTLALKRLRTTPLSDAAIILGLVSPALLIGFFQLALLHAGLVALSAPPPQAPHIVVAANVSGILVAVLAGIATSAVTSTPEKAQWTMLPLFIAAMGAATLLPTLTDPTFASIARTIPLVANADLTMGGWYGGQDRADLVTNAAVIAGWLVALLWWSRRTFRWERRR